MKKNIILLMTAVFGVFVLAGCSEDDLKKTSAVLDSPTVENDFDRWLAKNYMEPYNIDFKYRFKDVLGDMDYRRSSMLSVRRPITKTTTSYSVWPKAVR